MPQRLPISPKCEMKRSVSGVRGVSGLALWFDGSDGIKSWQCIFEFSVITEMYDKAGIFARIEMPLSQATRVCQVMRLKLMWMRHVSTKNVKSKAWSTKPTKSTKKNQKIKKQKKVFVIEFFRVFRG